MPTHENETEKLFDISLKLQGGYHAANSEIDLYDISTALRGLHRSLAITSHFFFNNEIITRAPEVKNIKILANPPKIGSWEIITSAIAASALIYKIGTSPHNTPIGHLVWSLYDLIIHKCTGRHVDINKSLYLQYAERNEIEPSKLDSLAQKLDSAVVDMHRPIMTQSATRSILSMNTENKILLDSQTLDLANRLIIDIDSSQHRGRVAAYSANTRSGMIYSEQEERAIPFEIDRDVDVDSTTLSRSLMLYDIVNRKKGRGYQSGFFYFLARRASNQAGATKKYYITHVYSNSLVEIAAELS